MRAHAEALAINAPAKYISTIPVEGLSPIIGFDSKNPTHPDEDAARVWAQSQARASVLAISVARFTCTFAHPTDRTSARTIAFMST